MTWWNLLCHRSEPKLLDVLVYAAIAAFLCESSKTGLFFGIDLCTESGENVSDSTEQFGGAKECSMGRGSYFSIASAATYFLSTLILVPAMVGGDYDDDESLPTWMHSDENEEVLSPDDGEYSGTHGEKGVAHHQSCNGDEPSGESRPKTGGRRRRTTRRRTTQSTTLLSDAGRAMSPRNQQRLDCSHRSGVSGYSRGRAQSMRGSTGHHSQGSHGMANPRTRQTHSMQMDASDRSRPSVLNQPQYHNYHPKDHDSPRGPGASPLPQMRRSGGGGSGGPPNHMRASAASRDPMRSSRQQQNHVPPPISPPVEPNAPTLNIYPPNPNPKSTDDDMSAITWDMAY